MKIAIPILCLLLAGCAVTPPLPGPVAVEPESANPQPAAILSAAEIAPMLPELSIRRGTMAEAGWWLPGWFDGAGFHATDAAIPRGDSVLLLQAKEGSQTAYVADLHGSHHSRDWTLAVLTVPGSKPFCTIETSTNLLDWKPYLTACSGSVPVAASETARYFRLP